MLAPCSPPNIAIQPAATQPTKGIEETAGAAAAPTLVPTNLPVPSALPTALIQASLFHIVFISFACAAVNPGFWSNQERLLDTAPP